MEIKDRVALIRKNSGMSMRAFSDVIGVSFGVINNIENDKAPMTRVVGIAICCKFHVREEWLFDGTGDMYESDDLVEALAARRGLNDLQRRILQTAASLSPECADMLHDLASQIVAGVPLEQALPPLTAADLPPYVPPEDLNQKKLG